MRQASAKWNGVEYTPVCVSFLWNAKNHKLPLSSCFREDTRLTTHGSPNARKERKGKERKPPFFRETSTHPHKGLLTLRNTTVAQGNRDPASPEKTPLHASRTGSNSSPHTSAPLHTNTRSWVSSTWMVRCEDVERNQRREKFKGIIRSIGDMGGHSCVQ